MMVERVPDEVMKALPRSYRAMLEHFYRLMGLALEDLRRREEALERFQEMMDANSTKSP